MLSKAYREDFHAARKAAHRGQPNPFVPGSRRDRLFQKHREVLSRQDEEPYASAAMHRHPSLPRGAATIAKSFTPETTGSLPSSPPNQEALQDAEHWDTLLPFGWTLHDFSGRRWAWLISPDGRLVYADAELLSAVNQVGSGLSQSRASCQ